MTPLKILALLVPKLRRFDGCYAVAGGLAASFYRKRPRLTNDVDIGLDLGGQEKTKKAAVRLLKDLKLHTSFGWIAGLGGRKNASVPLVIGHAKDDEYGATIDFLLPAFPWLKRGVERAQSNRIDFGFAELPTLTPEDVILAKAFALSLEPNRFQDLDDLQSIFTANNNLDLAYLVGELERMNVSIPVELDSIVPGAVKKIRKRNRREK